VSGCTHRPLRQSKRHGRHPWQSSTAGFWLIPKTMTALRPSELPSRRHQCRTHLSSRRDCRRAPTPRAWFARSPALRDIGRLRTSRRTCSRKSRSSLHRFAHRHSLARRRSCRRRCRHSSPWHTMRPWGTCCRTRRNSSRPLLRRCTRHRWPRGNGFDRRCTPLRSRRHLCTRPRMGRRRRNRRSSQDRPRSRRMIGRIGLSRPRNSPRTTRGRRWCLDRIRCRTRRSSGDRSTNWRIRWGRRSDPPCTSRRGRSGRHMTLRRTSGPPPRARDRRQAM